MPFDDEADDAPDDASGFQPPLPPDDRLWRHPSELGAGGAGPTPPGGGRPAVRSTGGGPRVWLVAGASGLAGAMLTMAVLAGTGQFDRGRDPAPVEQVRISVPTNPGASEVELAQAVSPSVAHIAGLGPMGPTTGTAIVVRSDGHLVTTADAIDGAQQITVTFTDGQTSAGTVVGADADDDLAVVKVDRTDLVPVTVGQEQALQLGERTTVLSTAERVDGTSTVAVGLVSGLGQRVDRPGGRSMHGMIQTNIRLSSAETGAPLIDSAGAVVGLITRRGQDTGPDTTDATDTTEGRTPTSEGVTVRFATAISWAKDVADDLIDQGHVTQVWLGIRGGELSPTEVEAHGLDGARVTEVSDASPAEAAGLEPGDIITTIESDTITSMSDVIVTLRQLDPGEEVPIGYQRGGAPGVALVTLAPREDQP